MSTQVFNKSEKVVLYLFLSLFLILFFRTAWLAEDAYITFRTVDNFVHGYGLTWNIAERVQTYTHPLWMFLLSGVYFLTREMYFTPILLCIGVSIFTLFFLVTKLANSIEGVLVGLCVLFFSKSYIDFSTSGLENPLTHLFLVLFFFVYFKKEWTLKTFFFLSLFAGFGMLNRMDVALLYLPPLVYVYLKVPKQKGFLVFILGILPFIVWEFFSLFYYGFLFPNTAYAKMCTGLDGVLLIKNGFYYLWSSLIWDPITPLSIIASILVVLLQRKFSESILF